MANSVNPNEVFEKILIANLQRIIDFLKFAEAKNAALLTISSAWTIAIFNLIVGDKNIPNWLIVGLYVALPLSICAAILSIISFLPRTNLSWFLGGKRAGPHPSNLLYYGDISSLPLKQFEQNIRDRYLPIVKQDLRDEYIHDLIVQISVNSQITMRKMALFRYGITLVFFAALVLLIPAVGLAIKHIVLLW
ncbi:MAG: Pycsar system effector family protein [Lentisphaerota bacterium]